jgi:uncharacterized membrane protein
MTSPYVILLAFLLGAVAGLRSMAAPAIVAWAIREGWLDVHGSSLSFMGSTAAIVIFTLFAIGELVVDKFPSTPSRLRPPSLIARAVLGGLSGAVVAAAGSQSAAMGAFVGAAGGIAGSFAGYAFRMRLGRLPGASDLVVAMLEDVIAIGGGLLIVLSI